MNHIDPQHPYSSAAWTSTRIAGATMWQSRVLCEVGGLAHVFTSAGFNMSASGGPDTDNTAGRRRQVCAALDVPVDRLAFGRQIHGTAIALVARGNPLDSNQKGECGVREGVDGLVTTMPDTPLMALSADCPVLLLFDAKRHVLGLAHSGWRGTLAGMPTCLVDAMATHGAARPQDLLAVVSPSARVCCYEIQHDVRAQVDRSIASPERFIRQDGPRQFLDLGGLIAAQLKMAGVPEKAIHLPEQCSICDDRFYSYRRQGPGVGHAALVACMRR